jgi:hypothetical protein
LAFATGASPTTAVTIDSSQNVGIGTASPAVKLDVIGTVRSAQSDTSDAYLRTQNSFGNTYYLQKSDRATIYTPTTQPFTFDIAGGERMRIDTAGNVGIGTTNPTSKLYVSSTGLIPGRFVSTQATSYLEIDNATGGALVASNGDALVFCTSANGIERARIDASGNLIVGSSNTNATIQIGTAGSTFGNTYLNIGDGVASARWQLSTGSYNLTFAQNNGSGVYVARSRINDATGAYVQLSDARVKTNVVALGSVLDKIEQLRPVNYSVVNSQEEATHIGFIAQEVLAVFPESVHIPKDTETDHYGINYGAFAPLLVKAIQEQQALITQLQADVAALKGQA